MKRSMFKSIFGLAAGLAVVLGGFTIHEAAAAQRKVTVRLATIAPKGTSYHTVLMRLADDWKKASDGKVDVIIYPGGIQGGEEATVERMRINRLQAGLLTGVGLAEIVPEVTGLQVMPMMFRTLEELDYVSARLQPRLERLLLNKGFVVLFWGDAGWVRFFSKHAVVYPDDLRRQKIFTWTGDARASDLYKAAGFNPVPLETGDILPALHTGLIEAVPMPPVAANAGQVYDPAPHMLDLNWAPLVGALVINADTWDKVSPELKPALLKAAERAGKEIQASGRKESDEAVEAMKRKWGLKVQPVTPEIEAAWRQAAEAVYPKIRGNLVPADIFDEVQALLREYRARGK